MEWTNYLYGIVFVLLGIIIILIGKYLSVKIIMPNRLKYKVTDEKKYIKSGRIGCYCIGIYWILFGIILMFINGWSSAISILFGIIQSLIMIVSILNSKKYTT
ncbi:hypothetical protein [Clostridium estertheticum]|uniref:hypothetical protein n=1 Tax=Clostridium estertheticum TaxID=238834 RepID=UPI001C6E328F|nr:hypothetical protein [Clostridium estertheticum]MBW9153512.1 hypothetical protein [Clostridium estertheticum]WLC86360.1 hypothetical protein KTC97_20945 [Clostridium estertheticum]